MVICDVCGLEEKANYPYEGKRYCGFCLDKIDPNLTIYGLGNIHIDLRDHSVYEYLLFNCTEARDFVTEITPIIKKHQKKVEKRRIERNKRGLR